MRIFNDDMTMEFKNADELNAWEANDKLKKAKAEAERKAKEEAEKKLSEFSRAKMKEINDVLQKAKSLVDEYEKATGNKLIYSYDYVTESLNIKETRNSIDFAWDDFIDDFFKSIRTK